MHKKYSLGVQGWGVVPNPPKTSFWGVAGVLDPPFFGGHGSGVSQSVHLSDSMVDKFWCRGGPRPPTRLVFLRFRESRTAPNEFLGLGGSGTPLNYFLGCERGLPDRQKIVLGGTGACYSQIPNIFFCFGGAGGWSRTPKQVSFFLEPRGGQGPGPQKNWCLG